MTTFKLIKRRAGFTRTDYRIFQAGLVLLVFGGAAKLSGIVRDMVIASNFGLSDDVDAYVVAFAIPSFAISVVVGAISASVIPTYVRLQRENPEEAFLLAANLLTTLCIGLLAVTVAFGLASSSLIHLLAGGFSAEKASYARHLLLILLPVILVQGVEGFWISLINAQGRFALPASTPILTSTLSALVISLCGARWGIWPLAIASVAGITMETAIIALVAWQRGVPCIPRWRRLGSTTRMALGRFAPYFIGSFVMSGSSLVDQAVAARLGSGDVAALSYSNKLIGVILTLIATAIGTAVLPYFSRFIAVHDWGGARNCFYRWAALMLIVSLAVAGLFVAFAGDIIRLIFQRGRFSADDAALITQITAFYCLQFPFYFGGILGSRMMIALDMSKSVMLIGALNFVLNLVFDIVFARIWGIVGIAVASTGMYSISCACIFIGIEHRLGYLRRRSAVLSPSGT